MNLTKISKVGAGLFALSAILFSAPSQAAQPVIAFSTATTQVLSNFTIGYRFTVGASAITVTQLGVFDKNGDGLLSSHDVGIWDSTGTTLLASGTVASGVAGSLTANFRYVSIANLALSAGTSYLIGSTAGIDEWGFNNYTALVIDPAITVNENRYTAGGALAAPTTNNPAFPFFAGPNFQYATPGGVPEPGTIALLLASGFSSLGVLARNRRIRK